ncbi:MAG: DsbA family protein [Legionella sp.]|nr:DsbA family protein [Legionella sp.]
MKFTNFLTAGAFALSLVSPIATADDADTTMSDAQKKQMEQVIHDYLVKNPEVLLEASQALQQKQQQNMQEQAKAAIKEGGAQMFQDTLTVSGNPKGNVTVVEFFDYRCHYCAKMTPILDDLVKNDSDVRIIYKEFPIFGGSSELASKAAIAAAKQGKYKPMHDALFNLGKNFEEKDIMNAAQKLGLDMNKLKKDMDSKEVKDMLDANRQLAEKLKLMGTPAFIVAPTPNGQFKQGTDAFSFIPGAATKEALQKLIKEATTKS